MLLRRLGCHGYSGLGCSEVGLADLHSDDVPALGLVSFFLKDPFVGIDP